MAGISSVSKATIALLGPFLILVAACDTGTPTSPSATPTTSSPGTAETTGTSTNGESRGATSGSTSRATTTLAPPTQEAPLNGATDQPTTVTVRWHDVNRPDRIYNVQIARDSNFSSLIANARITDGSIGHTVFNLADGTQYFWRVRLSVGSSTSPWSPVWTFHTTSRDQPGIPTLIFPANGATGVPRSPTLAWTAVPGADSYQVEISPFGTAYFNVQGTSITFSEESLSIGYTDRHVWRVRAKNAAGTSDWSEQWLFTRTP